MKRYTEESISRYGAVLKLLKKLGIDQTKLARLKWKLMEIAIDLGSLRQARNIEQEMYGRFPSEDTREVLGQSAGDFSGLASQLSRLSNDQQAMSQKPREALDQLRQLGRGSNCDNSCSGLGKRADRGSKV